MSRDLSGQRLLITGASSGIGAALAQQTATAGARLALVSRSADKLKELAARLTPLTETLVIPADVTAEADRKHLFDVVQERWGGLDVLLNNAGVGSFGHFADSSEAVLRTVMELNFFAPAELMRLAIPILTRAHRPAIVNVASMCGRRGMPAWSEYSASKFALCGLSEALRGELVRFGIDVLLIVPGLTATGLSQHLLRNEGRLKIDFTRAMPTEYVAAGILKALRRRRMETVLGREARLLLWVNRFFPRLVDRLIARKVRQLYASI
jgi:short-subunit dehydrogenase